MEEKATRENMLLYLLERELDMIGKTVMEIVDNDRWRFTNTLTRSQYREFRKNSLYTLQKVYKFNRTKANNTFEWWYNQLGLRLKG